MVINVTTDKIKEMMDACYMAKRVRDLLPELPKGVAPSYIHYLDIIQGWKAGMSRSRYLISVTPSIFLVPE